MTWVFWTIVACMIWTITRMVIYGMLRSPLRSRKRRAVAVRKAYGNDIIDVEGQIVGETELAWRFYDGSQTAWIPKSQSEWDSETRTMTMPKWLGLEKGFI